MGFNPRDVADKTQKVITAWETLRSDRSFGGMTLTQFKTAVKRSLDSRDELASLESQRTTKINERNDADKATLTKIEMVVSGVKADPDEGPDSEFLDALGYVRKSERKSGLTKKKAGNGTGNN